MAKVTDPEVMRSLLAKAAWKVIASEGIEAATLRRVGTQAGCTTGLITHYFRDKNELVTFAYRRALDKMIADAAAAISRAPTVADKLLAAVEAVEPVRASARELTVVLMNFWAAAAVNSAFAKHVREDYQQWRELIGRVVREGIERKELRGDTDVRTLVDVVTLLGDGFSIGITLTPTAYDAEHRHAIIRKVLGPFIR